MMMKKIIKSVAFVDLQLYIYRHLLRWENVFFVIQFKHVAPVYKKSDSKDCRNYRSITLGSTVGKYVRVLKKRLRGSLDQTLSEEEGNKCPFEKTNTIVLCGYREGLIWPDLERGCMENTGRAGELRKKPLTKRRKLCQSEKRDLRDSWPKPTTV